MKKLISKLVAVAMAGLFIATPCVYGKGRQAKKRPRPAMTQTTARTDTIDPRDRDYHMVKSHDDGIKTISVERKQEIIDTIWRLEDNYVTYLQQQNLTAMATCRRLMMTLLNQLPKFDAICTLLDIHQHRDPASAYETLQTLHRQGMILDSSHILLMENPITTDNYLALFIWPIQGTQVITVKF